MALPTFEQTVDALLSESPREEPSWLSSGDEARLHLAVSCAAERFANEGRFSELAHAAVARYRTQQKTGTAISSIVPLLLAFRHGRPPLEAVHELFQPLIRAVVQHYWEVTPQALRTQALDDLQRGLRPFLEGVLQDFVPTLSDEALQGALAATISTAEVSAGTPGQLKSVYGASSYLTSTQGLAPGAPAALLPHRERFLAMRWEEAKRMAQAEANRTDMFTVSRFVDAANDTALHCFLADATAQALLELGLSRVGALVLAQPCRGLEAVGELGRFHRQLCAGGADDLAAQLVIEAALIGCDRMAQVRRELDVAEQVRTFAYHLLAEYERQGDAHAPGGIASDVRAWTGPQRLHLAIGRRAPYTGETDRRRMTPELFWELIDATRPASHDPARHVRALHERLVRLAPRQIVAFDKLLREQLARAFHWDVWALAYLTMEGCGDDAFEYFRAWLVLAGEAEFTRAINDPAGFAASRALPLEAQCESLLYVAEDAYAERYSEVYPAVRAKGRRTPVGTAWREETLETSHGELAAAVRRGRASTLVMKQEPPQP